MGSCCISSPQIDRFVEIVLEGDDFLDDESEMAHLLEQWHAWETELVFLSNLLSQMLERKLKIGEDASSILRSIVELASYKYLTIEGFSENFVQYLLRHKRLSGTTIEDELIRIRNFMGEGRHYRGADE